MAGLRAGVVADAVALPGLFPVPAARKTRRRRDGTGRSPSTRTQESGTRGGDDREIRPARWGRGGKETTAPTGSAAPDGLPADPGARKSAENRAYRQEAGLTPAARRRGVAH